MMRLDLNGLGKLQSIDKQFIGARCFLSTASGTLQPIVDD